MKAQHLVFESIYSYRLWPLRYFPYFYSSIKVVLFPSVTAIYGHSVFESHDSYDRLFLCAVLVMPVAYQSFSLPFI